MIINAVTNGNEELLTTVAQRYAGRCRNRYSHELVTYEAIDSKLRVYAERYGVLGLSRRNDPRHGERVYVDGEAADEYLRANFLVDFDPASKPECDGVIALAADVAGEFFERGPIQPYDKNPADRLKVLNAVYRGGDIHGHYVCRRDKSGNVWVPKEVTFWYLECCFTLPTEAPVADTPGQSTIDFGGDETPVSWTDAEDAIAECTEDGNPPNEALLDAIRETDCIVEVMSAIEDLLLAAHEEVNLSFKLKAICQAASMAGNVVDIWGGSRFRRMLSDATGDEATNL